MTSPRCWMLGMVLASAQICASCAAEQGQAADPAARLFSVDDVVMQLVESESGCKLTVQSTNNVAQIPLDVPWPCAFHIDKRALPRVIGQDNATYLLVEHSRPDPDFAGDCLTQLQAVRVLDGEVTASPTPSRVASCPPFQWDEYAFTAPFEP